MYSFISFSYHIINQNRGSESWELAAVLNNYSTVLGLFNL